MTSPNPDQLPPLERLATAMGFAAWALLGLAIAALVVAGLAS